jgi:type VI secretion system protein ImpM
MPGTDVILPGFFGKLPAAGDFVSRRLPPAFVRAWDRWASRHLVPRPEAEALYFVFPGELPATGVVVPSADRAGRHFPLTLAAAEAPGAPVAAGWYDALAALGRSAASGALDVADLDRELRAHPLPPAAGPPTRLLLWTAGRMPREADPEAPGPVLDALLGAGAEAG